MSAVFRDDLLRGKVAFVTGGSSGIGLRIAERFAQQGAKVAVVGRSPEKLDSATGGIRAAGGEALGFAADVRDYAALTAALQKTREQFSEIDILLCGAAGNFPAPALGMSANGFKAVIDIDLLGTFNTCRAAYEHLRKPGASVLAISASHAFRPIPFQSHVCAGKAGVDILMKTLAVEWGSAGVRVNVVTPGPVDDTEGMRRLAPTEEIRQRLAGSIPLRRFAAKDEIADLALFLCSDAAAYITGAIFVCDGGQSLTGSSFATALAAEK
ncbi:MAG TPA: SDR family oxidoreductase [Bryobacteraceae bacterium]|nr:SDR family oxidoreductase [Bryobacteraceae bacterium]